jgi:hypothetical protein
MFQDARNKSLSLDPDAMFRRPPQVPKSLSRDSSPGSPKGMDTYLKKMSPGTRPNTSELIQEIQKVLVDWNGIVTGDDLKINWEAVLTAVYKDQWKKVLELGPGIPVICDLAFRTYTQSGDRLAKNFKTVSDKVIQFAYYIKDVEWHLYTIATEYLSENDDPELAKNFIELYVSSQVEITDVSYLILDSYLRYWCKITLSETSKRRYSNYNPRDLANIYYTDITVLADFNHAVDLYMNGSVTFDDTNDSLGRLMENIVQSNGTCEIYLRFLEMGGPILYANGEPFSNAVEFWGLRVLKAVSQDRLNFYMKYRVTALNLIDTIDIGFRNAKTDKQLERNYKLLEYLLKQDTRDHKSRSVAYNSLKESLSSHKDISSKLAEMIPN